MIYGSTYGASGNWGYGPAMVDPLFNPGVANMHPWGPPGPVVIGAPGAVASDVHVGVSNYNAAVLNITSAGTLDVSGNLWVAQGSSNAVLNNDGAITIGVDFKFNPSDGEGAVVSHFNNTGTVDVVGNIDMSNGSYSRARLEGGTVEAAGLLFDNYYACNIDLTEGVLILDGDQRGELYWNPETGQPDLNTSWGAAWWTTPVPFDINTPQEVWRTLVTAYDGTGTVMYDYDITNPGQTTIWAVPEPGTLLLLCLGLASLALIRRK
jgi:hypothetical protein